ncbi:DUF945 family protein [Campylobacter sp. RM16188]|uniref:DUF945 family protein n=1 Tax=Campylobacter sp. RM16188 TaxID=1705725 RepID=UPI001554F8EB|nr:DUF945 family protein [Campylobacter sp. RM16188]
MKKILIFVAVLAALIFGGLKFYSMKVEEKFYSVLNSIKSVEAVAVENEKFNAGFFASNGNFDVVIKKDSINNLFALNKEDGLKEDLKLKITSSISHGVSNLINGIETIGDVELASENLKDVSNKIFDTAKPLKFKVIEKIGGDKNARFELVKINKEVDGVKFNMADTFMDFKLDDAYKILQSKISNDFIKVNDDSMNITFEGIHYDVIYEKPLDMSSLANYTFANDVAKTNIKKIGLNFMQNSLDISDISSDTKLITDSQTIAQVDSTKIAKIKYDDIELVDFVIDTRVENIDKKSIEGILNSKAKDDELYFQELQNMFQTILQRGPRLVFEKLNFKNSDNKTYESNLEISLDPSSGQDFSMMYSIMRILNLNGYIKIDTTPGEFLFKNLQDQKAMIDQSLLDSGVFVQNGNSYESKFNYNKRTQDIIFNNKISLKTFLATMF